MSLKKGIAFGLLLWIIMFAIVSVFVAFGWYDSADEGLTPWVVAIIGGVVSLILAGYLKPHSVGSALGYGITFAVIGLIFDWLITVRFNPEIFSQIPLWVSYVLIVLAPLARIKKDQASRMPSQPM